MHISAINDNRARALDPEETGQERYALAKLKRLTALRNTLARLDPAQSGPPVLETASNHETQIQQNDKFPSGWLHELWTPHPHDHAAATAWALSVIRPGKKPLLWITSLDLLREQGLPYAPGLVQMGMSPEDFILVRTRSMDDALWALEEAIKSNAFAGVIGEITDLSLTNSRRLSLAVQTQQARCLLLIRSETAPQSAAYSRWRTSAYPSAEGSNTNACPGAARLQADLHKHRGGEPPRQTLMEWQDATHCFHMVSPMVNQPMGTGTDTGQTDQYIRAAG